MIHRYVQYEKKIKVLSYIIHSSILLIKNTAKTKKFIHFYATIYYFFNFLRCSKLLLL